LSTKATTYDLPLNQIRRAFRDLLTREELLLLDGAALGNRLPARMLPLTEVTVLLEATRTSARKRRALWAGVVTAAQGGQVEWTWAALGLAYPGLTATFVKEGKEEHADWHERQAVMVAEFLTALAVLDVTDTSVKDIAGWLCSRALHALRAARAQDWETESFAEMPLGSAAGLCEQSDPDVVLERAVRAKVLTEFEADLIGRAYLESEHRSSLAKRYKMSVATVYRRRAEAVERLVEALENGTLRAL
jgi:hypothetical protein